MKTAPEYTRMAEKLVEESRLYETYHNGTCPEAHRALAEAQIFATLSVAAANCAILAAGVEKKSTTKRKK